MGRLFEQGLNDPSLTDRVASGQAASATKNTTWTNIIAWIETKLTILASQVTQNASNRFVTDTEKATWNSGAAFLTTILDIGDWDMDTAPSVTGIVHGLTFSKIRRVTVLIRDDGDTALIDILDQTDAAGAITTGTATIDLTRETGGVFDNAGYAFAPYNRGWIIIDSIP